MVIGVKRDFDNHELECGRRWRLLLGVILTANGSILLSLFGIITWLFVHGGFIHVSSP